MDSNIEVNKILINIIINNVHDRHKWLIKM